MELVRFDPGMVCEVSISNRHYIPGLGMYKDACLPYWYQTYHYLAMYRAVKVYQICISCGDSDFTLRAIQLVDGDPGVYPNSSRNSLNPPPTIVYKFATQQLP